MPALRWLIVPLLVGCDAEVTTAAIDRCKAALDADGGYRSLAVACADIYREKGCRDAYVAGSDPKADPSQFAATVFAACRDAYCPKLEAPKPRACSVRANEASVSELGSYMGELNSRILVHELGADKAGDLTEAFRARAPKPKVPEPALPRDVAWVMPKGCKSVGATVERSRVSILVHIEVTTKSVSIDGKRVAVVSDEMGRAVARVDAVFTALKERKFAWRLQHPSVPFTGVVLLQVGQDVSAVLTKSVFQTVAYAGFPDVTFLSCGKE